MRIENHPTIIVPTIANDLWVPGIRTRRGAVGGYTKVYIDERVTADSEATVLAPIAVERYGHLSSRLRQIRRQERLQPVDLLHRRSPLKIRPVRDAPAALIEHSTRDSAGDDDSESGIDTAREEALGCVHGSPGATVKTVIEPRRWTTVWQSLGRTDGADDPRSTAAVENDSVPGEQSRYRVGDVILRTWISPTGWW
jgi:hypothetical protein